MDEHKVDRREDNAEDVGDCVASGISDLINKRRQDILHWEGEEGRRTRAPMMNPVKESAWRAPKSRVLRTMR